jgi:hypothetical protein
MGERLLRLALGLLLVRAVLRSVPPPAKVEVHAVASRGIWRSAVRRLWLPGLLVVVAAALVIGGEGDWGDRLPGQDFYIFGAQTFPVLLVALAVEMREPRRRVPKGSFITILVALGVGELVAVLALSGTIAATDAPDAVVAWDEPSSQRFATAVAISLAWAIIGLLLIALRSTLAQDAPSREQAPRR